MSITKTIRGAIAFVALATVAQAQDPSIIVQSTTSTANSGLLDYLLPKFTEKSGVAVNDVADGTVALVLAAASQQVVIDVPDGDEALITPGLEVGLGGSGGNTGIVTLLRSVERSGSVVVQAVIAPSTTLDAVDGAVVTVTVSVDELDGVLVIPSEALVSRLDGSYALQVVLSDGISEFRSVEILGVSGSTAAVRGEGIEAGMEVLQPA